MRAVFLAVVTVLAATAAAAQPAPQPQYSLEELKARFAPLAPEAAAPAADAATAAAEGAPAADAAAAPAGEADGGVPAEGGEANAQRGFFIVGGSPVRAAAARPAPAAAARTAPPRVQPAAATRRTAAGRASTAPAAVAAPARSGRAQTAARRGAAPAPATAGVSTDLMIGFEFGSAVLTPQARANAGVLAEALRSRVIPCERMLVEGHTDRAGGRDFNLGLSKRRAEAVVDFLVGEGVPRARLSAAGRGFDSPLDPANPTSSSNRRVEGRCVG